jgi:hypothetical protein
VDWIHVAEDRGQGSVAGSENSLTFMTRRVKYIRGIYFLAEQL